MRPSRIAFALPLALMTAPLSGCTVFGNGWAFAQNNAPFKIGRIKSALFTTDPDNDDDGGDAMLLLTDESQDCDAVEQWQGDDDDAIEDLFVGNGLLFVLEAWKRDDFDDEGDWSGLFVQGYSYGIGNGTDRTMVAAAYQDGSLFTLGSYYSSGEPSWVDVDSEGETVKGKFDTPFWHGSFNAERCGEWEEDNNHYDYYDYGDYGYDTGR